MIGWAAAFTAAAIYWAIVAVAVWLLLGGLG